MSYEAVRKFTGKAVFEKSVNSLIGLIEGITIDSKITENEINFLELWINDHEIKADVHPFSELFPVVQKAILDGFISDEEKEDILWLCNKLTSTEYFDEATSDMQKLHAILAAVAADGVISVEELRGISKWLEEHQHLKNCWPYDEIESLILEVLKDKVIDPEEHRMLLSFFGEFVAVMDNKTISNPIVETEKRIGGLCSVCPEINFPDAVFCITGKSFRYTRNNFETLIKSLGAQVSSSVTKNVNYLIVGAEGSQSWAYSCYGRKVEQAVSLRKGGHKIVIVHENDFYDAVEDL